MFHDQKAVLSSASGLPTSTLGLFSECKVPEFKAVYRGIPKVFDSRADHFLIPVPTVIFSSNHKTINNHFL